MPIEQLIKTVLLPVALIIIMFGMGMTLVPADFVRVVKKPKAKFIGLVCQLLLLPVTAFLIAMAFGLKEELAVGLMLIAACPGGATSNIISHLSKGDTALSVTLTAVSSMITVFTIPLIVGAALDQFMGKETEITLEFLPTVIQLSIVTIFPVCAGMMFRQWNEKLAAKLSPGFSVLSLVFLALIIVLAVLREENLGGQFVQVGLPVLVLNLLTMATGFGFAFLARLPVEQRVTISIESGIQNGTLALGIALGILESSSIAVPAVVYSLLMFGTGGLVIALRRRF